MKRANPTYTPSQLDKLVKEGKIRGYEGYEKEKKHKTGGRIVTKFYPIKSKEKNSIIVTLIEFAQERGLTLYEEYHFHPERKWRFDWCIPDLMTAVEYNGIMSEKSRHTTVTGYNGDMNKLNAAQALGWRVIQLTPLNYTELLNVLNDLI